MQKLLENARVFTSGGDADVRLVVAVVVVVVVVVVVAMAMAIVTQLHDESTNKL
jgi:hypothetical protein